MSKSQQNRRLKNKEIKQFLRNATPEEIDEYITSKSKKINKKP